MTRELLPGMEGEQRSAALSQWYTPPALAKRIVEFALRVRITDMRVLEPSAGRGALVRELLDQEIADIEAIDIDTMNAQALSSWNEGVRVWQADFLRWSTGRRFDLAVMNPPFEDGQTEKHIMQALKFCARVVCHCP